MCHVHVFSGPEDKCSSLSSFADAPSPPPRSEKPSPPLPFGPLPAPPPREPNVLTLQIWPASLPGTPIAVGVCLLALCSSCAMLALLATLVRRRATLPVAMNTKPTRCAMPPNDGTRCVSQGEVCRGAALFKDDAAPLVQLATDPQLTQQGQPCALAAAATPDAASASLGAAAEDVVADGRDGLLDEQASGCGSRRSLRWAQVLFCGKGRGGWP